VGKLESVTDHVGKATKAVTSPLHSSSGFNAEDYFHDLLRQYLPRRYAVASGLVVNASRDP